MKIDKSTDFKARMVAKSIAINSLDGKHDILLACRDLSSMRGCLLDVPKDIINIFIGVNSEIDGLAIGNERNQRSTESLIKNDSDVLKYETEVRDVVTAALTDLIRYL